jgi:hypothetical protein
MFRSIPDICGQVSCRSVLVCVMFSCLVLYSWISVDLSKKIHVAQLNPNMLVGKYIPSLVAKKFNISREYAQRPDIISASRQGAEKMGPRQLGVP